MRVFCVLELIIRGVVLFVCVSVCIHAQAHTNVEVSARPEALDPFQLELLTAVSCLRWVLGTKLFPCKNNMPS